MKPGRRYVVIGFGLVGLLLCVGLAMGQSGVLFVESDMVGVGTSTPAFPLHVTTTGAPANTVLQIENDGPARFRVRNSATGETWNVGIQSPSGTGLVYSDVGDAVSEMLLDVSGNLTIAGSLTTAGGSYPDYVFAEHYPLLSLSDLEAYIEQHGHLPKIPTAENVEARGGVNMSELQLLLLEKIEELTLYTLHQQRSIDALQASVPSGMDSRLAEALHNVDRVGKALEARDQQVEALIQRETELSARLAHLESLVLSQPR